MFIIIIIIIISGLGMVVTWLDSRLWFPPLLVGGMIPAPNPLALLIVSSE